MTDTPGGHTVTDALVLATVWLAYNSGNYDDVSNIHCAFTDRADAEAYKRQLPLVEIEELRVYPSGGAPTLKVGWEARAVARPRSSYVVKPRWGPVGRSPEGT